MMYIIEKYGPISGAVLLAAALWYFSDGLLQLALSGEINISSLYSAMFDWSSIQTGFLFGVFGYVSGKSSGFLAEVKKTQAMQTFNSYTRTAICLGFLLTFASIPLIVSNFDFSGESAPYFWIFITWAFLATWSFLSFARVAYVFGVMLQVRDRERAIG